MMETYENITDYKHDTIMDIAFRIRLALLGTSSSSSPGPDGIHYRFIKAIKDTVLGDPLFEDIARVMITREILYRWQNSKVVIIPKPSKDHGQVKRWRSINLINCKEKLTEKVIVDLLQEVGVRMLLHSQIIMYFLLS